MGSPSPSLISSTMHIFVLLSIVSLACGAPMPEGEEAPVAVEAEAPAAVEEEAPQALPYVHDATGDVAEVYVHEEIPAVDEEIAAEAYVHDATGDVAEPYVHEDMPPEIPAVEEEIAAEPYVHEEISAEVYEHDATGDAAEPYIHEDIAAEVYTHEEPVVPAGVAPITYTVGHPTAGVIPIASYAGVYAGHAITYPYAAYPYAVYHTPTGCVNNVGSVVPCA